MPQNYLPQYTHSDDVDMDYNGKDTVIYIEGEQLVTLPGCWTEKNVRAALELANRAHRVGYMLGSTAKAKAIVKLLEIEC